MKPPAAVVGHVPDGRVALPGGRAARGTLDSADGADAAVVTCPPHPQNGGHRGDRRLTAVSAALSQRGVDCLRFDYGPWDGGRGERSDACAAVDWARERYDRVGLFGYSFGGAVALLAAAERGAGDLAAVSALAPASRLDAGLDAADALKSIRAPAQVVYGERDDTADWEPVVERARELDRRVVGLSADHFFVGQEANAGGTAASFLADRL